MANHGVAIRSVRARRSLVPGAMLVVVGCTEAGPNEETQREPLAAAIVSDPAAPPSAAASLGGIALHGNAVGPGAGLYLTAS